MPRTADPTKPSGEHWGPYPSTAELPNVAGAAALGPLPVTGSQVGVFGTMATITSVATTHTDNVGPMVYLD